MGSLRSTRLLAIGGALLAGYLLMVLFSGLQAATSYLPVGFPLWLSVVLSMVTPLAALLGSALVGAGLVVRYLEGDADR